MKNKINIFEIIFFLIKWRSLQIKTFTNQQISRCEELKNTKKLKRNQNLNNNLKKSTWNIKN